MEIETFVSVIWVLLLTVVEPIVTPVPLMFTVALVAKFVPVNVSVLIVVLRSPEMGKMAVSVGSVAVVE